MVNKKVIIASTVKNEEKNLEKHFKIIDDLIDKFKDYFLIFVISDSKDNSENVCKKYIENKNGKVLIRNFKKKYNRVKKLEISRNCYLNFIKKQNAIKKFDFLIVMDVDGVNDLLTSKQLINTINKKKWSAIFPSQLIFYYDIFALRIENLIEYNFITKIKKESAKNIKLIKKLFSKYLTKFFFIRKYNKRRFIEVKSAFGGLGIYKLKIILKSKYYSNNGKECEHVSLNKNIHKKFGQMFVDKRLINSSGVNIHTINGFLCSYFNYFAKRFLKKIR